MSSLSKIEAQDIGKLGDYTCKFCQALMWTKENRSICCNINKVLPIIPPEIEDEGFRRFYDGKSALSERFLNNIVGFNLVFSFAVSTKEKKNIIL